MKMIVSKKLSWLLIVLFYTLISTYVFGAGREEGKEKEKKENSSPPPNNTKQPTTTEQDEIIIQNLFQNATYENFTPQKEAETITETITFEKDRLEPAT